MGLDAKDRKIYDLLNDKLFLIPENQRKYVWDSNNWTELMDDISLVYKEKINSHFNFVFHYRNSHRKRSLSAQTKAA